MTPIAIAYHVKPSPASAVTTHWIASYRLRKLPVIQDRTYVVTGVRSEKMMGAPAMPANIRLVAFVKENYALVMDADRNPLLRLPPAQRFQTMIYLSLMWTAIFCGAVGAWFWYGEILIAHLLLALGALITGLKFRAASKVGTDRDFPLKDGTARYDDVWGA